MVSPDDKASRRGLPARQVWTRVFEVGCQTAFRVVADCRLGVRGLTLIFVSPALSRFVPFYLLPRRFRLRARSDRIRGATRAQQRRIRWRQRFVPGEPELSWLSPARSERPRSRRHSLWRRRARGGSRQLQPAVLGPRPTARMPQGAEEALGWYLGCGRGTCLTSRSSGSPGCCW
jgi:hypothetical protein